MLRSDGCRIIMTSILSPATWRRKNAQLPRSGVRSMNGRSSDRNLLLGILALQMDFIPRDALIRAMHRWTLDKRRSLSEILVELAALDPSDRLAPRGSGRATYRPSRRRPRKKLVITGFEDSVRFDALIDRRSGHFAKPIQAGRDAYAGGRNDKIRDENVTAGERNGRRGTLPDRKPPRRGRPGLCIPGARR